MQLLPQSSIRQCIRQLLTPKPSWSSTARTFFCKKKQPCRYKVRLAVPSDVDSVMDFVMQTYMQEEPMMTMVGLKGNPSPALVHLVYGTLKQGMTLLVVDGCDHCVAGACLNGDVPPSEARDLARMAECCDAPPSSDLVKFGAFVARESNVWASYCVPSVFTCEYLAVHPKYRGKGFAGRLLAESWVLARDLGYKVLRVDASSEYTSRACQKFGWQCVYSIPYQRYHDHGRFVFTNVKEPHTVFRIYCDYIDCYSSYFPKTCKKTKP